MNKLYQWLCGKVSGHVMPMWPNVWRTDRITGWRCDRCGKWMEVYKLAADWGKHGKSYKHTEQLKKMLKKTWEENHRDSG